jgi:phosphoribosylformimino-5-aminoimidazole carboxamide ribotide isomerase
MARHWLAQGARRLHIVDLNGARSGLPVNEPVIRKIIKAVGDELPVQLGGGIRDLDTIERYIDDGVSFVVIGTAAVKNPGFLHDACTAFAGHVIVALDAKGGKDYGAEAILYTDIGRDGMMSGVNIEATVELARHVKIPVIASGGVASMQDIEKLCAVESEGIEGAILGRSLYEGAIDFKAAQQRADELSA